MIKIRKTFAYLFVTCFLFLFSCNFINADGNATVGINGSTSIYVGNNIDITVAITGFSGVQGNSLRAISGAIDYDSSYLEYVTSQSLAPFNITYSQSSNKFNGFDTTGSSSITGYANIIKFTFRAKKTGSTRITFNKGIATDAADSSVSISDVSKTINISNPPSSNANLSSLSISNASINFNKNTTSYSVNVGKDISSVTVNASAEDAGARVSGVGSKSLNYGYNSVTVTVTAPSGATKAYTINITREDPRSSNANLSSLKVDGGTISPNFDANTTTYEVSVPFSIENLSVKATTVDSKASINVAGANGLVAEETKDVTVTVTAENGAKKTYTIRVTRGKDPNKVLSTNNYLSSLTTNQGILSPAFNKEKTTYIIYLPYEIDKIELNAEVEDKKYGTLIKDGPEKLEVGSNKYTFTVTAEDSSTRVYSVIVVRGESVEDIEIEKIGNVLLKELKIEKGSLDKPFNNKVNVYKYDKKKGFKILPIAEDDEAKLTIIEHDDVISIIVESGSETNVYTLIPKENYLTIILIVALGALVFSSVCSFLGYRIGLRKDKTKMKKIKSKKEENITTTQLYNNDSDISKEIEDKNPFESTNDYDVENFNYDDDIKY